MPRCFFLMFAFMLAAATIVLVEHAKAEDKMFLIELSNQQYLSGYRKSIHGEAITYHSPSPDITSALLVRATDGTSYIEWESDPVKVGKDERYIYFVWLAGVGCNLGTAEFYLFINGDHRFTFRVTKEKEWRVEGKLNSEISFKSLMEDRYSDLFGLMTLKLPVEELPIGKPITLKVIGEKAGSNVWYMTFKSNLKESVAIKPLNALMKEGERLFRPVILEIVYLGKPVSATIRTHFCAGLLAELQTGINRFTLKFPQTKKKIRANIHLDIASKKVFDQDVELSPMREWTIYLVQHTHTDIGYTRPQTEILAEHLRFIDYALDYCDLTDDYPDDAKFRWTCEASWPVREYLKNRPTSQIARLQKRVQEGRIEVTGMMFNMSEIADETVLTDFVQPIQQFRDAGLPVTTIMQNDVNGIAWCLVDYLHNTGVKYLIMGQHGHRALAPFDKPTTFWWESPAGKRLLAFRADHYMTGNFWGIQTNNMGIVETELFRYLAGLEERGYPHDRIAIQYSGYVTDNSPPSTVSCDFIKQWNERYEWPKLRSATAHEFMDYIKTHHGNELPMYRAAWPDWWTDGFGSAVRETAAARITQAEMIANLGLLSLADMLGAKLPIHLQLSIAAIQDALLFYDEHTLGAAESISDPTSENSMVQWSEKAAYAWEAVKEARMLREAGMGILQSYLPQAEVPTIAVINTLNWERSDLHEVYIDHQILPNDKVFRIVDTSDRTIPVQYVSGHQDGSYWAIWVDHVPALGFCTYRIEVSDSLRSPDATVSLSNNVLENAFYRLEIDVKNGAIVHFFDKVQKADLVESDVAWQMGQLIYETLGNRRQLEQFHLDDFRRTSLKNVTVRPGVDGSIWQSAIIIGQLDGCDSTRQVQCEIRLFKPVKRLELHYTIRKLPVIDPEGIYVAFPFQWPKSKIVYEAQGGVVTPGETQLPGSSSDWHTIQSFACVRNATGQIVISSNEIPLMQFGDINLGKFQRVAQVDKPYMYSWVLNNYWTTNFKASQEGELKWSYALTSSVDNSNAFATRFGWECRVPLLSRVLPENKSRSQKCLAFESLIEPAPANILLVTARPPRDANGIILHFRELEGQPLTALSLNQTMKRGNYRAVHEVDVFERKLKKSTSEILFGPYEVKFVKLER